MTNEEAIKVLTNHRRFVFEDSEEDIAIVMAIRALKNEQTEENNDNSEENNYNSAKEDTAESYEWCTGCKEYDNEKHCCHRYTNFIRYSLQENIDSVLEDIKAEILDETVERVIEIDKVIAIVNKHIKGK